MKLSRRNWQVIALLLFLVAVGWAACGWSLIAIPVEPTETLPDPEGIDFEISRSCFLGPAFALGFLAYLASGLGVAESTPLAGASWLWLWSWLWGLSLLSRDWRASSSRHLAATR